MGKTTHFGYKQVDVEKKQGLVKGVFDSVAGKYDLMNDVMSMGTHRLWKNYTIASSNVVEGDHVLDIAGGTGDLALKFRKKVGPKGKVILSDINSSMLFEGRKNLLNHGVIDVEFVQANAESLPFDEKGGTLLILEFSKVENQTLEKIYDLYSFNVIPKFGEFFANDEDSYQYLAESIRKHPDQETLKNMVLDAGFEFCEYHNLTGGIVALHKAIKA